METTIRPLRIGDIPTASALVQRVFEQFEAPDYTPQGIATFQRFTTPDTLIEKFQQGAMAAWGAYRQEQLVGVLAMRDQSHISLLFVDPAVHRQGIARSLFTHFQAHIVQESAHRAITVNSSPYAVEAYLRLGFLPTDTERTVDGIRFTPMLYRIKCKSRWARFRE